MNRFKNNRGFTLLELLLVLSLWGIILGISIPRMDHTNFYLKSQGRELCSDIRYIRLMRMTEGGLYRILLGKDYYKVLNGVKELKTVELASPHQLLFINNHVMFSFDGAPDHSGTIKIMNAKNNKYMVITIVPASGRVLLKDEIFTP